jgi:hypothetical protein
MKDNEVKLDEPVVPHTLGGAGEGRDQGRGKCRWCTCHSAVRYNLSSNSWWGQTTPTQGTWGVSDVTMTLNLNKFEHGLIILTKSIGYNGRFPRCVLTERDWAVIVIAGTLLRKSSSRVLEMWPSLVKTSFFTIYQISEIVLLTKKMYCLPKIFVKRFLLVGQCVVYKSLSLCISLNTSFHGCRRVRVLTALGEIERKREGKWSVWLWLLLWFIVTQN